MKRYLRLMSPEERSTYTRWKATWVCIYVAIAVVLAGILSLLPARDVEMAQNTSTAQKSKETPRTINAECQSADRC